VDKVANEPLGSEGSLIIAEDRVLGFWILEWGFRGVTSEIFFGILDAFLAFKCRIGDVTRFENKCDGRQKHTISVV